MLTFCWWPSRNNEKLLILSEKYRIFSSTCLMTPTLKLIFKSTALPINYISIPHCSADADTVRLRWGGNGNAKQGGGRPEDCTSDSAYEVSESQSLMHVTFSSAADNAKLCIGWPFDVEVTQNILNPVNNVMLEGKFTFREVSLVMAEGPIQFQLKYNHQVIFKSTQQVFLPQTWSSAVRSHSSLQRNMLRHWTAYYKTTSIPPSATNSELSISLCQLYNVVVWTKWGCWVFSRETIKRQP